MIVLLISSTDEYDPLFSSTNNNLVFQKAKNLAQANYFISETEYDVIFINVPNNEELDRQVEFVKQLRKDGIWSPACYITSLPIVYEELVEKMDGYNCITMIDSKQDVNDITKQIEDILFITSTKGQEVLDTLQDALVDVHEKIDSIHDNIKGVQLWQQQ